MLTESHERTLRTLLSHAAREVVPLIADAVQRYPPTVEQVSRENAAHGRRAHHHLAVARRILRLVRSLEDDLRHARDNDFWKRYHRGGVPPRPKRMLDILDSGISAEDVDDALASLGRRARDWEAGILRELRQKPGRKPGIRRHLASWIAWQLHKHGVPLRKSVRGKLAKTLAVVYEATGHGVRVPFSDVVHAIDRANARYSEMSVRKRRGSESTS